MGNMNTRRSLTSINHKINSIKKEVKPSNFISEKKRKNERKTETDDFYGSYNSYEDYLKAGGEAYNQETLEAINDTNEENFLGPFDSFDEFLEKYVYC